MESTTALLRLDKISYRVDNKTILDDINFELQPSEFKLITGPSGCGKSTLLKIVASLLSPTKGSIFFENKDYLTLSPEEYRQQVSYCTQTPMLFGETVYDNLKFPYFLRKLSVDDKKLAHDLDYFCLPESIMKKGINELSGGEKQRISLIRNLQFMPKILLLDEITSALDEDNKTKVNDVIHHYVKDQNLAVLWVTHDQNEIKHADDVILLPSHNDA
ncbi:iron ABC transporter ATP-binding protein FetA [Proteus vulgaris]|uniref:Iron ABC transporter ATP-binding protein FetA n=1 Tax=Proteus genomosp. 6 TaxID=1311820 RepID=A0ABV1L5V9_9GAMM|nr:MULTISPECIES: iron ABC transporter ATP-binding protein FetA [Proteus]MBG2709794.1 iron ABC transporter ATP-binding protein FetA [Proteus mirabilis]MBG2765881.1 iron ABC transporter ATP-binding protein FetA [Proteus mirabilis]MBG2801183.1 iron ABC transporter ATP-binding protein FetA [Proteus mirabilis]MBG3018857.1 iron ABC transporter ATP-binding protein FetA [Proteus mirabilis]MBI6216385.1 iron ABC transporter ATP-binding protein FetA [Proteus vulgaris]